MFILSFHSKSSKSLESQVRYGTTNRCEPATPRFPKSSPVGGLRLSQQVLKTVFQFPGIAAERGAHGREHVSKRFWWVEIFEPSWVVSVHMEPQSLLSKNSSKQTKHWTYHVSLHRHAWLTCPCPIIPCFHRSAFVPSWLCAARMPGALAANFPASARGKEHQAEYVWVKEMAQRIFYILVICSLHVPSSHPLVLVLRWDSLGFLLFFLPTWMYLWIATKRESKTPAVLLMDPRVVRISAFQASLELGKFHLTCPCLLDLHGNDQLLAKQFDVFSQVLFAWDTKIFAPWYISGLVLVSNQMRCNLDPGILHRPGHLPWPSCDVQPSHFWASPFLEDLAHS